MASHVRHAAILVGGLLLFAAGIVLTVDAHLGLSPWDVLHQGLARITPLTLGQANVAVAVIVVTWAWRLGAHLGIGTIANTILVGAFVDVLIATTPSVGSGAPLIVRVGLLCAGVIVVAVGSACYIGAALGAGPRDALMLALIKRTGRRTAVVRGTIEAAATVAGALLGGTVGVGTVLFAVAIGPAVEVALRRSPLAPRPTSRHLESS